ncbi:hypothetical protein ACFPRL_14730 [Pseudoclavibacter helvolus]
MRVRKDSELKSVEFADASCVAAPSSEAPTNALFWPLIEVTMPWSAELRAFEMSSVLALKLLKLAFAGPLKVEESGSAASKSCFTSSPRSSDSVCDLLPSVTRVWSSIANFMASSPAPRSARVLVRDVSPA